MKEILERIFSTGCLERSEARAVIEAIACGHYPPAQVAAFLTAYCMRRPTVDELLGFRDALLQLCRPVDLDSDDCIDVCGTGGDNKNSFNISTLSAFVLAGCGVRVAKHGNYAVSSQCGSSNVLEALGVPLFDDPILVKAQLEQCGICFMHAPFFHPALKSVAPIRRELGVKTFLNILGPLVNPAKPAFQLYGVFNATLQRLYSELLQETNQCYMIVHSLDGYDEISLTATAKIVWGRKELLYDPEDFGLEWLSEEQLYGGRDTQEARAIFVDIIEGRGTKAQNAVVIANAGLALLCRQSSRTLEECLAAARESLEGKRALAVLNLLRSFTPRG